MTTLVQTNLHKILKGIAAYLCNIFYFSFCIHGNGTCAILKLCKWKHGCINVYYVH